MMPPHVNLVTVNFTLELAETLMLLILLMVNSCLVLLMAILYGTWRFDDDTERDKARFDAGNLQNGGDGQP
jgi:hypothetical protein